MAMGAFYNLLYLCFNIPIWLITFQMDPVPSGTPSYILNGICGAGTPYECPGPDVHVPLPNSGPLLPFSGRN